jgi:hypothetical protein
MKRIIKRHRFIADKMESARAKIESESDRSRAASSISAAAGTEPGSDGEVELTGAAAGAGSQGQSRLQALRSMATAQSKAKAKPKAPKDDDSDDEDERAPLKTHGKYISKYNDDDDDDDDDDEPAATKKSARIAVPATPTPREGEGKGTTVGNVVIPALNLGEMRSAEEERNSAKIPVGEDPCEFFPFLMGEIERINKFFVGKLAELRVALEAITSKRDNPQFAHHTSAETELSKLRDVYLDLKALQSYADLNKTGELPRIVLCLIDLTGSFSPY